MHNLISKLLAKRGIGKVEDLNSQPFPDGSPSERTVFESWKATLSKEEFSVEDIKNFCQNYIEVIENKWRDLDIPSTKKSEFIPYHTFCRTLLAAIESPKSARESLEIQLTQLLNK